MIAKIEGGRKAWLTLAQKDLHSSINVSEEKGVQTQTFGSGYLSVGWGSSM